MDIVTNESAKRLVAQRSRCVFEYRTLIATHSFLGTLVADIEGACHLQAQKKTARDLARKSLLGALLKEWSFGWTVEMYKGPLPVSHQMLRTRIDLFSCFAGVLSTAEERGTSVHEYMLQETRLIRQFTTERPEYGGSQPSAATWRSCKRSNIQTSATYSLTSMFSFMHIFRALVSFDTYWRLIAQRHCSGNCMGPISMQGRLMIMRNLVFQKALQSISPSKHNNTK